MLMQNLGAQQPIMEEEEEDFTQDKSDNNETDEDKKRRLEGTYKCYRKLFVMTLLYLSYTEPICSL
jgi:hypothetical protein